VFYCRWFVPDLGFSVLSSSRIYYQDPKFEKSDFLIFLLFSRCSGSGCGILSGVLMVTWMVEKGRWFIGVLTGLALIEGGIFWVRVVE